MSRLSQVSIATIIAMTGLYLTSTSSKAMPVQQTAAIEASSNDVQLARYTLHRRHYAYRYGYRLFYSDDYGWRRPVLGIGLGVGGLYLGL